MNIDRILATVEDRPTVRENPASLPGAESNNIGAGEDEIHCPLCGWSPSANDRWMCRCKHSWNTFDTGGVCPKCLYQWEYTQCLDCHAWSPHSAWYPKN